MKFMFLFNSMLTQKLPTLLTQQLVVTKCKLPALAIALLFTVWLLGYAAGKKPKRFFVKHFLQRKSHNNAMKTKFSTQKMFRKKFVPPFTQNIQRKMPHEEERQHKINFLLPNWRAMAW